MNKFAFCFILGINLFNLIQQYLTRPLTREEEEFNRHHAFRTRWPSSNTINFELDPNFNATEVNEILNAMKKIEKVSCIRFKKLNSTIPSKDSWVNYMHFTKGKGYFICYSDLLIHDGHVYSDIYLGDGCIQIGALLHEIMHNLGFDHTQNRSDRDLYLDIHFENLLEGKKHNFRKLIGYDPRIKYVTPFDYDSILIYNSTRFSKNGQQVITPKKANVTLLHADKKSDLSKFDVKLLNYFYNCSGIAGNVVMLSLIFADSINLIPKEVIIVFA